MIGVPKSGTSSFHRYLQQHPQIFMAKKEPHFFSFEGERRPDWAVKDIAAYADLFADAPCGAILGEVSPWYLYSASAANGIKQHTPDAKLIVILRNPVERAYSAFLHWVRLGGEHVSEFGRAVELETQRIREGAAWDFHYVAAGRYCRQLNRYFETFHSNQIQIVLYDDLSSKPVEVMRDVFRFLGVDTSFQPDVSVKYNSSRWPRVQWLHRALHYICRDLSLDQYGRTILPKRMQEMATNVYKRMHYAPPPKLSGQMHTILRERLREDIVRTQELIKRDLSAWLRVG